MPFRTTALRNILGGTTNQSNPFHPLDRWENEGISPKPADRLVETRPCWALLESRLRTSLMRLWARNLTWSLIQWTFLRHQLCATFRADCWRHETKKRTILTFQEITVYWNVSKQAIRQSSGSTRFAQFRCAQISLITDFKWRQSPGIQSKFQWTALY